jgi:AbrB family looped-hinge helix DNA binding protein
MEEAKITAKGQITIPRAVREHLGVKPGDRIRFFLHPSGEIVARPVVPVARLRGVLADQRRKVVSVEEMDDAIAAQVTERNRP